MKAAEDPALRRAAGFVAARGDPLRSRAAPGAYVLAFCCSHHVGPELFRKIAFGAALDADRCARVLRTLGAPVDHPVSIDHPEGHYLTGLLLQT